MVHHHHHLNFMTMMMMKHRIIIKQTDIGRSNKKNQDTRLSLIWNILLFEPKRE